MKYLFAILSLAFCSCKKEPVKNSDEYIAYSVELKWITTDSVYRKYTIPEINSPGFIYSTMLAFDTAYGNGTVKYNCLSEQNGRQDNYHITGFLFNNPNDSIEVQVLIDGIVKAKAKDVQYVELVYEKY